MGEVIGGNRKVETEGMRGKGRVGGIEAEKRENRSDRGCWEGEQEWWG